jgi:hypothetical protein
LKEEAGAVSDNVLPDNVMVDDRMVDDGATGGTAADDPAGIVAAHIGSHIGRRTGGQKGRQIWTCIGTMGGDGPVPRSVCSSGFRGIDRLLPAGGIGSGSLIEWIGGPASGAAALAFAVAGRLRAARPPATAGTILVVDRSGRFHPPAVMPWLERPPVGRLRAGTPAIGPLVVVRPSRDEDEIWAIDQALRCPGVTAVVAWPQRVSSTAMRRWQLAARGSGCVGFLVRPVGARREPSWAEARLNVVAVSTLGNGPLPAGMPSPSGHATPVSLVGSLAVRRLRLALQEGPWSCEQPPDRPTVEVALDMATGREAFGREVIGGDGPARAGSGLVAHGTLPRSASVSRALGAMPCRAS